MTAPRLLLKGASYLVTRRCLGRRFLLRPGKVPNMVVGYALARAAVSSGVRVHAFCVMSNHVHLVVTDPSANLPSFLQSLDGLVARAINSLYGQYDYFWESSGYNATALGSAEDVLDRCAYVLANPVAAGLVRQARRWPGLWSAPTDIGRTLEFERPTHFFNPRGYMPERIGLELSVPPGFASPEVFRERLAAALAAREAEATSERVSFLGRARVLRQRALDRPVSRERHRQLRPRFAARDSGRRLELARRLKTFLAEYGEALEAWREGRRDVVFPEGTYHMRVAHRAACAGAG
jgi:REP element-mobilizing transposase RayT